MVVRSDAEVVIERRFYLLLEDVALHLFLWSGLKDWQDIPSEEIVGPAFPVLLDDPFLRIFSYLLRQLLEKLLRDLVEVVCLNERALDKLCLFFTEELSDDFRFGELALDDLHVDYLMRNVRDAGGLAVRQHDLQLNSLIDVLKLSLKVLNIEAVPKEYKRYQLFFKKEIPIGIEPGPFFHPLQLYPSHLDASLQEADLKIPQL